MYFQLQSGTHCQHLHVSRYISWAVNQDLVYSKMSDKETIDLVDRSYIFSILIMLMTDWQATP